jgi:hypothetical protein
VCVHYGSCATQAKPHTLQQRSAFFGGFQKRVDHVSQGRLYNVFEQRLEKIYEACQVCHKYMLINSYMRKRPCKGCGFRVYASDTRQCRYENLRDVCERISTSFTRPRIQSILFFQSRVSQMNGVDFVDFNTLYHSECKRCSDRDGYIKVRDLPDGCETGHTEAQHIHIDRIRRRLLMAPSVNGRKVGTFIDTNSKPTLH